MQTFSEAERAAIARGWTESGLAQDEYAAQFGIAGRTLRLWLARCASRQPPLVDARALLVDAIERLQALLAAVDVRAACQAERGEASPSAEPACRPAAVREAVEAKDSKASAASSPPVPQMPGNAQHADLDPLVAGVQAELAKGTKEPSAPNAVTMAPPPPERRLRVGGYFATMD